MDFAHFGTDGFHRSMMGMGEMTKLRLVKRPQTYRRQVSPRPQDRDPWEAWRSPRRLARSFCRRFPLWSACLESPTRISPDCPVCTPRSVPPLRAWRLWACCRRSHPAWCSPSLGTDSKSSTRIRETPLVVCSKQRDTRLKNMTIIFDRRKKRCSGCEKWEKSDIKSPWISLFHLDFVHCGNSVWILC